MHVFFFFGPEVSFILTSCVYVSIACFLNMFFIHYHNIYTYTILKEHTQEKYALKDVKLNKKITLWKNKRACTYN